MVNFQNEGVAKLQLAVKMSGLTNAEIAQKIGVSRAYVSQILVKKELPKHSGVVKKICDAIGADYSLITSTESGESLEHFGYTVIKDIEDNNYLALSLKSLEGIDYTPFIYQSSVPCETSIAKYASETLFVCKHVNGYKNAGLYVYKDIFTVHSIARIAKNEEISKYIISSNDTTKVVDYSEFKSNYSIVAMVICTLNNFLKKGGRKEV